MKIRKTIKAEIPTQQYGNVELSTSLEWDDQTDVLSKEEVLRWSKAGTFIDRSVRQEFANFHTEMEQEIERITTFGEKTNVKEKSRKEQIKDSRKARRA